jgi:hypothetical protein
MLAIVELTWNILAISRIFQGVFKSIEKGAGYG